MHSEDFRKQTYRFELAKILIPKSTFYYWVEEYKKIYSQDGLIITKHDYKKLEWENARMKKQLEAYQITGCSPQSTDFVLRIQTNLSRIEKTRFHYVL